jgi:hypothetical protein
MTEAATITPIVLWSDAGQGNLYLATQNTFLEFYDDENRNIKNSACARSASADGYFHRFRSLSLPEAPAVAPLHKSFERKGSADTTTPTNRSHSSSNCSNSSSNEMFGDNEIILSAELENKDGTPRGTIRVGSTTPSVESSRAISSPDNHEANEIINAITMSSQLGADFDFPVSGGYSATNMCPMSPTLQTGNKRSQRRKEMQPGIVKPITNKKGTAAPEKLGKTQKQKVHGDPATPKTPGTPKSPVTPTTMDASLKTISLHEALHSSIQNVPKVCAPPNRPPQRSAQESHNQATTMMIRGIPCSFSQEALMSRMDEIGLKGKYDFFYLPFDSNKNANLGYCFINFVDQESVDRCTAAFKGVALAPYRSAKTCKVVPATIQGLPSLWAHFRNTAVSRGSRGPMFLNQWGETAWEE